MVIVDLLILVPNFLLNWRDRFFLRDGEKEELGILVLVV